jgi:hypothetical protein
MTRTYGLSLLLALLLCGCREKGKSDPGPADNAAVPATPPVAGKLVLTAELAEISGPFPANELYNYAFIMKYKVLKVLQGEYPDADILVGHYNPRIARADITDDQKQFVGGTLKTFRVGDKHYLVLADFDGIWNGAVEDDYYKDRRARYWARWVDPL